MNTHKSLLHTFAFTLFLLMGLVALFAHKPTPVHAFAGDYALEFDGASDFVTAPTWASIIGPDWQTTKSISVWFRPMIAGQVVGQVVEGDMIVGDFPRWFGLYQATWNGQDAIWATNWDNVNPAVFIPVSYEIGEWVNITLVHHAGNLAVYKNGSFVAQAATGATATGHPGINSIALRIGGAVQIGGPPNFNCWETLFSGQVDEVRLWSNALSPEEVRQNLYRTLPVNPNLRAYYQMSNGSGTSLTDNSGNGNHATLQDGRPIPPEGCSGAPPDGDVAKWITSGAFAGPRNALAFDGVDDVVALNANANTILGSGWASGKTAELWAYPTGFATSVTNAADGDILIGNAHWGIARADIGGADRLWLYNNDGSEERVGIPYASGEWAHLALVHAGGSLNAYKNGALVGSVLSGNTANDADLLIGSGFEGQLDELRLWDSARSAPQIRENMFQTVRHDETGLAAYYRFDQQNDASVTTVYDTAVSSHHGAMTNMNPATAWVASTAFNTWIGSQSNAWADGANWSRYAAPTAADNVGLTNYPASHAPAISGSSVANSVLIATGATLTVQNGGSLRADGLWFNFGTLQNEGTLQQEQMVDGSAPVQFFADGNYGPFAIDGNGFDLGSTTITIRALANCTTGPEQTVQRCFDIEPTNSPTTGDPGSTLTFSFLNSELSSNACNTLNAFHWNGSSWDTLAVANRQCAIEPYSLQVTGVTDFSPFMLTSDNSPTAVRLNGLGVGETAVLPITFLLLALILLLPTTRLLNGRRQKT